MTSRNALGPLALQIDCFSEVFLGACWESRLGSVARISLIRPVLLWEMLMREGLSPVACNLDLSSWPSQWRPCRSRKYPATHRTGISAPSWALALQADPRPAQAGRLQSHGTGLTEGAKFRKGVDMPQTVAWQVIAGRAGPGPQCFSSLVS